jgi:hypothetical protein
VTQAVNWDGWTSGGKLAFPQMYGNCAGAFAYVGMQGAGFSRQNVVFCPYPGFTEPPCVPWVANEWMTVKQHIKIGTYNTWSSTVQMWLAREGQPSVLIIDCSAGQPIKCNDGTHPDASNGWYFENSDPTNYKFGKVWLHPYQTNQLAALGTGTVWYDELIISKQDIADPGSAPPPPTPPAAPSNLRVTTP